MKKYFQIPKWLFIVLVAIIIFRIPTFFEPYSYGDETIYLTLGEGMRQGLTLFRDIHDNKPPLLYATAAIAGSLFWFKAILMFWMLATTLLFWKLVEHLFPKNKLLHAISTIIFAIFTTIPLLEGRTANAELFMIWPIIGAFLLLLKKEHTTRNIFIAGTLFSVATLFKVPAAFDIPAIILLWIISIKKFDRQNLKRVIHNTVYVSLGFLVPIALTFIWYYLKGAFHEYLVAAWLQNFGYLSSFRPGDIQKPFLEKNGPLLLRGAIVTFGYLLLFLFRKRLSKEFILITAWLLGGLFAVTLSERPYPHYLIQIVPAASILLGMLFTLQTLEQSLTIIPLTLLFIVPVYFNFWHYKSLPYYQHFIQYVSGNIDRTAYLKTFGDGVPDTYALSEFIVSSTRPTDHIFVWGSDSSNVYALSRRLPPIKYVATYHIHDFSNQEEVYERLSHDLPELIVILPDAEQFVLLQSLLQEKYGLTETIGGAQVWKRILKN